MQFAALPNRNEDEHPLLFKLLGKKAAREQRECRCGLCRVISPQEARVDTNSWLATLQENLNSLRSALPREKVPALRITNERPTELPDEPSYTHVYLDFRKR